MSAFFIIRNDPLFRRYFDAISPFFWPVLYFQLKAAWLALQREKRTGFLLAITWWGGVFIVHRGDLIEARKPNPFALTKPRFDDPVWSTSVPASLGGVTVILLLTCGPAPHTIVGRDKIPPIHARGPPQSRSGLIPQTTYRPGIPASGHSCWRPSLFRPGLAAARQIRQTPLRPEGV